MGMSLKRARERSLSDLFFLTTEVLFYPDKHKYGDLHRWLCKTLNTSIATRQLYLLPRGHFKSSIITKAYVIQQLLNNPGLRVLILSAKDEHALMFSDNIKQFFIQNDRLHALFPLWCTDKDWGSKAEWVSPARMHFQIGVKAEPTVVASGFKSKLASKHYDLIVLDDPIEEDDTSELGIQESLTNYAKIIPLLDMGGKLIAVGTRYHYNDLYQHMMDSGAYRVSVRHALELPDTPCTRDECVRFAQPHNAASYEKGLPIAPTLFTREELESRLKEYEADPKRGASAWWHQYMNIPFAPAEQKFQPAWFVRVEDSQVPGSHEPFPPLKKWIALDTAWKDDEHPSGYDFTVVVVGGFDEFGRLYILDILRSKTWTMKQGAEAMITAMKAYGISRIITEKAGEVTFHTYFKEQCRIAGVPVQLITPTRGGRAAKGKDERIMAAQGPLESGRVFFRRLCDNYDDTVNEFCNLGRWTNNDIADAISMFFDEQVKQLAPLTSSQEWATPVRPMGFEQQWRHVGFRQVNKPDPLGRFGTLGPAETRQPVRDSSFRPSWGLER